MAISHTEAEELRARARLIIVERDRLANIAVTEARPLTSEEMQKLVLHDLAIDALVNSINHQHEVPKPSPAAPAPLPPNRSEPGSDYRLVASAFFELNKEGYRTTSFLLADYGKWLVATISAAHLGGIYFIGSLDEFTLKMREPALWALVIGLVLIISCGLATYYNWQAGAAFYAKRINQNYLIDPTAWPNNDSEQTAIQMTYRIAIALGCLSGMCILVAAYLLSTISPDAVPL